MNENKNAHPAVGAAEQAEKGNSFGEQYSHTHFSDTLTDSQERVVSLIGVGRENAIPRMDLAAMTGFDERVVRSLIQQARLCLVPIISFSGGYYIADNSDDLRRFARAMARRAEWIRKVALAMEQAADEMDGQEAFDDWWEDDGVE